MGNGASINNPTQEDLIYKQQQKLNEQKKSLNTTGRTLDFKKGTLLENIDSIIFELNFMINSLNKSTNFQDLLLILQTPTVETPDHFGGYLRAIELNIFSDYAKKIESFLFHERNSTTFHDTTSTSGFEIVSSEVTQVKPDEFFNGIKLILLKKIEAFLDKVVKKKTEISSGKFSKIKMVKTKIYFNELFDRLLNSVLHQQRPQRQQQKLQDLIFNF